MSQPQPQLRFLDLGATVASVHPLRAESPGARPSLVRGHRDLHPLRTITRGLDPCHRITEDGIRRAARLADLRTVGQVHISTTEGRFDE